MAKITSQDPIIIREAHLTDAKALSALSIHVWVDTYATAGVSDIIAHYVISELLPDYFIAKLNHPTEQFLIAEYDRNIVGFIELVENRPCPKKTNATLEIDKLYVMPRFHRHGIGSRLLQASYHLYQKKGYLFVWLTTWEKNLKAIEFYEKKGFTKIGMTCFKIGNIDAPNIVFMKSISVDIS
ncbi:MAG: GNAT family N-acetyltransferase [Legionellaceae bacterium]|nr:GNAT family N-acetyltransferase [Legionellaceae bacterium]